jgi:hypothetical protein
MTSFSRSEQEISSSLRMLIISDEFEVILKLLQIFCSHTELSDTKSNDALSQFSADRKKLIDHEFDHEQNSKFVAFDQRRQIDVHLHERASVESIHRHKKQASICRH